jgi:hypothetical protein
MPTCAEIMQHLPMTTLWAIWTRLSIFVPAPIIVLPNFALSTHVLAPISTKSSITTPPLCGTNRWRPSMKAYPNPIEPMVLWLWTITWSPMVH